MKVWIDQDLCTGDGLCTEIESSVFELADDGLAYVKDIGEKTLQLDMDSKPKYQGSSGIVEFPDDKQLAVQEAAEDCPGECIFIEP